MVDQGELEHMLSKTEKRDERRIDRSVDYNAKLCVWKYMSQDPYSTTFQDVRDDTHALYKCYDCLGSGMSVCESFTTLGKLNK